MPTPSTVTTLQQASSGIVGKPSGSTSRFASVLTDAQLRALLGSGSGGLGAKYLADDSTWKSIDLSEYLPLAGGTMTGDLKFTDATYDIGKSGATRPRDGFFSRNFTVGGTATSASVVTGYGNYSSPLVKLGDSSIGFGQDSTQLYGRSSSTAVWVANTAIFRIGAAQGLAWSSTGGANNSEDLIILRDAANSFAQRNGTSAQCSRLFNTYTSATSFETLQFKANAAAAYQIGSAIGSAGGTTRAIDLGRWNAAGVWSSSLLIDPVNFLLTVPSTHIFLATVIQLPSNGQIRGNSGNITLSDHASGTNFGLLRFGGTSSSYPAIKRSSTTLSLRLADDSADAALTCGAITASGDLKFTDATYDIGKSGVTRPRDGFFSRDVVAGTSLSTAGNLYLSSKVYTNTDPAIRMNFGSGSAGGIYGSNGVVGFASASTAFFDSQSTRTAISNGAAFAWANSSAQTITATTFLYSPAAGTVAQRNSTNAQCYQLFNTYTSATNIELMQMRGVAAANFELGPMKGSAGGTLRGLTIGGYANESAAITPWLTFTNTGSARFVSTVYLHPSVSTSYVTANAFNGNHAQITGNSVIINPATGGAIISSSAATIADYGLLTVANSSASKVGITVHGATSQTANLQEWRDVAQGILCSIGPTGQFIETPPASVTLTTNGQFSVEMTSNTAGNLVYRGSDGTTRRCALVFI